MSKEENKETKSKEENKDKKKIWKKKDKEPKVEDMKFKVNNCKEKVIAKMLMHGLKKK